jgi:hypothetical protein
VNVIKFGDEQVTATGWLVAVYDTDRHYGGPEEGSWYYDSRELVAIVPVESAEAADGVVTQLEEGEYRSTGNRYSVGYSGTGHYDLYVYGPGDEIVYKEPTQRPHYE